ncbi:MAG: hypothetical protein RI909_2249 [Bacteroidota bacterium]|jgi:uncharacterized protein YlzI (FlbEa/FlbD family)
MNAQPKTTEKTMLLYLADSLVEAQRELDELTLQLVLGKAEVKEKFEEVKKQFRSRLTSLKNTLVKQKSSEIDSDVIAKLDDLEELLNKGTVENKEMFIAQRKLIRKSLLAFEDEIKRRLPNSLDVQHFGYEVENFKLKMEILRLRFVLKRFTIQDEFKDNVDEVRSKITKLTTRARLAIKRSQRNMASFKRKIKKAIKR